MEWLTLGVGESESHLGCETAYSTVGEEENSYVIGADFCDCSCGRVKLDGNVAFLEEGVGEDVFSVVFCSSVTSTSGCVYVVGAVH